MRTRSFSAAFVVAALLVPVAATEATAASPLRFSRAQYDSPGSDSGSNASLNAEWVRITNHASTKKVLTGWTLRDPQNHVYRFPAFSLRPGASVRVHSGAGSNTGSDLYWRSSWYVWNNSGDKAILRTGSGALLDTCSWGDGAGAIGC
jgi:hypothetical protein